MRDSKPRIVEREILDQVSEEVLVDPMQNNEVVRPAEVVDEKVDHVVDDRARTNVVEWFELIEIRPSSVT